MIDVCYVSDAPFVGGAERYLTHLATGLDRARFRPHVVMRRDGDPTLEGWREDLIARGVPVERVPMRVPFHPRDAAGIRRAIAATGARLVHVNLPGPYDGQMGLAAPIARLAGARAVVTTEHLPMVEFLWKRALVKRIGYAFVDRVITVCNANVPWLAGRQGVRAARIRVIPNGVRRDFGRAGAERGGARDAFGIPRAAVAVVFVGNLLEHKGLFRVIEALGRQPDAPWHLVVVGTGPEEARCRALLVEKRLEDRASLLGGQSAAEVELVLSCVDLLTLPSLVEGMPYVILEAMASHLPVVATDVFGIPEMVVPEETGLLVPPGDDAALGQALHRMIGDAGLRERMGQAARKRFEAHFTLERQIEAVEAVYMEVLDK